MTKRELVVAVATKQGLTQNEVSAVLQCTLDTIIDMLAEGERLEIRNFGVFEVKTRDARLGRNPRTGQEVAIEQKRVTAFKPGKMLKEWIQGKAAPPPGGLFATSGRQKITDSPSGRETTEPESQSGPVGPVPPPGGQQQLL